MRNRVLLLCLVFGALLVPRANWAADKCFLLIDGVSGESQDALHKGWIDLYSWSWGLSSAGGGAMPGGGSAKSGFQDFHFVMQMGTASPALMSAVASLRQFVKAQLECRNEAIKNPTPYLVIKFEGVTVSSYQTGGSVQSNTPCTDQVSLNYSKISQEYTPIRPDGSTGAPAKSGWDLKAQKSWLSSGAAGSGSAAQGGGSGSGGAAPATVSPAVTSPAQAPVRTAPAILNPRPVRVK